MTKPLVFMMDRTPVMLPVDRLYARNHMWAIEQGGCLRFGLSAYAVRLLGEICDLEWSVGPGAVLTQRQPIGSVEGAKAVSELFAPLPGTLTQFNLDVVLEPELISSALYDTAWLFDLAGTANGLMSPEQYLALLHSNWPVARSMLRGPSGSEEKWCGKDEG